MTSPAHDAPTLTRTMYQRAYRIYWCTWGRYKPMTEYARQQLDPIPDWIVKAAYKSMVMRRESVE